ncbi:hypothetical protein LCGC14_3108310, partial [marine sediment metagenome]
MVGQVRLCLLATGVAQNEPERFKL